MIMKIGITSGEIISILEEENAPLTLVEIEMLVKESKDTVLMSMGWLIRERLVHAEIINGTCFYTRKQEEESYCILAIVSKHLNNKNVLVN